MIGFTDHDPDPGEMDPCEQVRWTSTVRAYPDGRPFDPDDEDCAQEAWWEEPAPRPVRPATMLVSVTDAEHALLMALRTLVRAERATADARNALQDARAASSEADRNEDRARQAWYAAHDAAKSQQ